MTDNPREGLSAEWSPQSPDIYRAVELKLSNGRIETYWSAELKLPIVRIIIYQTVDKTG